MNLLLFNLKTDADDSVLGFTTDWINALAKKCNHIVVITMVAGRLAVPDNVTVYSVGKEKGYSEPRRLFVFYRILRWVLSTEKIDACFAHMMPLFAALAGPVLKLKGIPQVLWYTHKSVTLTLKLAVFFSNTVITAADGSFRLKTPKKKVVGHGVDTSKFHLRPPLTDTKKTFRILSVGRIMPVKRLELAIEAIRLIHLRHPETKIELVLIGDPYGTPEGEAYQKQLKQQVQEYDLTQHIQFVGGVPFNEVNQVYQDADCFVNLAETGGIDKAVLEAMASGVAVVVNQSFAEALRPELAKDWVVDWNAEQLSERLLRLVEMPLQQREDLGKQLRQIVVDGHDLEGLAGRVVAECVCLIDSDIL